MVLQVLQDQDPAVPLTHPGQVVTAGCTGTGGGVGVQDPLLHINTRTRTS